MDCLSESTVAGFFARCLSSERREAVEVHVDRCGACRRLLVEMLSQVHLASTAGELHTTLPALAVGAESSLARGTVVGRFVVLDFLGAGGMSVVYTAYDPELDRKVALKLLHPGVRDASERRARILAEAQAMARVNHANVTAVYDVGTYREQVFAAIELVEGVTLRAWMSERSRSWREVVDVFLLAGEGLGAAHAAGVIHRDFKPENVLVGHDGRVKVVDFGLATAARPSSASEGEIVGTPEYLPVEGFRPGGADERGDQFSFCVALHEALHGRRPFASRRAEELEAEVRRGPALRGAHRDVPASLNNVVRRGLALAPEDRYPSMSELLADVRRAVEARRRRWTLRAAVGAPLLAFAITAFAAGDDENAAEQSPCAGAATHLAGVWDRARREKVRAAFVRTGWPSVAESFERLALAIDQYAARWTTTWLEACEATEIRHEQSAMVRDLRMVCLARARIHLRDRVDTLAAAGEDTLRDGLANLSALPALDACSDVAMLRSAVASSAGSKARTQRRMTSPGEDAMAPAGIAEVEASRLGSRPDFRLPFACGEAWQVTHERPRSPADRHIAFYLPGRGASAGLAVYPSAPGWVSHVSPEDGEVHIHHGGGWFTIYRHMSDIAVSVDQYVGRGLAIGRVGNVNVESLLGGPGPAHLHYEQAYESPAPPDGRPERRAHRAAMTPHLEGETLRPGAGTQVRTSTNNCFGGGTPGGAVQYDVPISPRRASRHRATMEIMVRRSDDHALFERWFERGWNSAPMPHTIVGQPAVAVFDGRLHVVARKRDGTLFDLRYDPLTGWETRHLEGQVTADPDVGIYGLDSNLHVAARGRDGFLYHWWTTASGAWTRPVRVGHLRMVGTPALLGHYGTFYIVARTEANAMWAWKADHRREWWATMLPGHSADHPDIAVDPLTGRVTVVARGLDNRLYRWQSKDPDAPVSEIRAGWSEPELVDAARPIAGAPAATIYQGTLHIVARGQNDAIEHWWNDGTWRWAATAGAYSGDVDVVQFGRQLQTVGRGPGGHLTTVWFDPATGAWNVEDQGVSVD